MPALPCLSVCLYPSLVHLRVGLSNEDVGIFGFGEREREKKDHLIHFLIIIMMTHSRLFFLLFLLYPDF